MGALSTLGLVIAWVAGIAVLIKLFQVEGALQGFLGLLCMLFTFMWGWDKAKDPSINLKTWMYIWTGAFVLGIILDVVGRANAGG